MGRDGFSSAASHLKTALVKKMNFVLLSFKLLKWRFSKDITSINVGRRSRSFHGRGGRRRLCGCFEDDIVESSGMMIRRTRNSRAYAYNYRYDHDDDYYDYDDVGVDVDQRAEIFISNFRSRLLMEREASLKLRYSEKELFEGRS